MNSSSWMSVKRSSKASKDAASELLGFACRMHCKSISRGRTPGKRRSSRCFMAWVAGVVYGIGVVWREVCRDEEAFFLFEAA